MGCEKAWELMMSRLDGEIEGQDQMILENHLRRCPECRRQNASLHAVLLELDRAKPLAPESTERKVMGKIVGVRHKKAVPLLPYVVLPTGLLAGILTFLLYQLYMAGPMALIDKAWRSLMFFYKVFQSVVAVSHFLFNTLYLREILVITGLSLLAGIIVFIFGGLGRKGNSEVYWRTTK